jgi:hypothetical protein
VFFFSVPLIPLFVAIITVFSSCASCCCSVSANHGRRLPLDLIGEEPRVGGAAAAAAGGRLPALHAAAQLGVAQPIGQVLRESPGPCSSSPRSLTFRARACKSFDDLSDRARWFSFRLRARCRATGSSQIGRRWTWTWRTTCSRSPGRTRRTRRCHRPRRRTGGCSPRSCSTTGRGSSPSGTSRRSRRTSRLPTRLPPTTPGRPSSGATFPR